MVTSAESVEKSSRSASEEGSLLSYDPRKLIVIFLRRLRTFAVVALLVLAAVLIVAARQPRTYAASANLLIEPRQTDVLKTNSVVSGLPADSGVVDTEVQLLGSTAIGARVADALELYSDPEFNSDLRRPSGRAAPNAHPVDQQTRDGVVNDLLGHVQAKRSGLTYVIVITARSESSEKAARIANSFAETYIQAQLDAKLGVTHSATTYLDDRLQGLQAQVEAGDAAVQNYKISHGLLSSDGATMAEQEVSSLNQQIAAARADLAEKQARLQTAKAQLAQGGGGADVAAALGSETVRNLRAQEADTSRRLAELSTRYGPKHPDVQKTENQLTDINTQIQAEINRILSSLQADVQVSSQRLASLTASQGGARGTLASNNSAQVGLLELQRKADAARGIYEAFLNRSKETSAAEGIQQADARVTAEARPSNVPVTPNMKLAAALGVVVALAAGVAAIGVLEMFDTSLRTSADVEDHLGVAYAGGVPTPESSAKLKRGDKGLQPQDYLIKHPFSSFAEAFRSVRAHVLLAGDDGVQPRSIAVTSALPKEGKSVTSFCLMRTIAQAGSKVVLVDCDLRRRGVSQNLGKLDLGLIEVLEGTATLDQALIYDEATSGFVLPVAATPSSPRDFFSGTEFDDLLVQLKERFDIVILDTPPALALADARTVAAKVDRTLFLARWGKTPRRATEAALSLILESGANVAGLSLTRIDMHKQASQGYGDYSYYYKQYRSYYTS